MRLPGLFENFFVVCLIFEIVFLIWVIYRVIYAMSDFNVCYICHFYICSSDMELPFFDFNYLAGYRCLLKFF